MRFASDQVSKVLAKSLRLDACQAIVMVGEHMGKGQKNACAPRFTATVKQTQREFPACSADMNYGSVRSGSTCGTGSPMRTKTGWFVPPTGT